LSTTQYRFNEVAGAPDMPGVYSWYYRIELTDRDIAVCIADVEAAPDINSKEEVIRAFLDRRLFRYYKEEPYSVEVTGPLKPRYAGLVEHISEISQSLCKRVAEEPQRLNDIKTALIHTVPRFASPIYIGVAKRLRSRLMQHVRLIESLQHLKASAISAGLMAGAMTEEEENDHKFAYEVTMLRDFATSSLVVNTLELSIDDAIRYDLENILNRINYPLCGRR
jgi:hypothetical protein